MTDPTLPNADPENRAPPTIDATAAQRATRRNLTQSPWLHEEVARRMAQRLQWLRAKPKRWVSWHPLSGGLMGQRLVQAQFAQSQLYVLEPNESQLGLTRQAMEAMEQTKWWHKWTGQTASFSTHFSALPAKNMDMVWANMQLHTEARPLETLKAWRQLLNADGYLMFSCLGPDSLIELRELYALLGWPPPCQSFTDMHDWGDLLLEAGFAEPVMDVERISLSYQHLDILLRDLRSWGRNLHPQRFKTIAPNAWRQALADGFVKSATEPGRDGQFRLTFEIIYGHALQAPPKIPMHGSSIVSLEDMRSMLGAKKSRKA